MAIGSEAQKNHSELFPGKVSSHWGTDPELIEYFDNFAFDEVIAYAPLDVSTRLMVQLAALLACQATGEYRIMLGAALNVGVTPVQVKEIVYQAVPFVGMARVYDLLNVTNEVLVERGVTLPLEPQSTTTSHNREERGLAVQKEAGGDDVIDQLYANAAEDERHFQRLLSANCFGDHFTRTGLELKMRELLTFAMLVSMGGCDPQALAHAAASLRVGNDRATLIAVITQLLPFIGYPRALNALRVINEATAL